MRDANMFRHTKQKSSVKIAQKVAKRRGSDSSSSPNLSDDDGYSAVEEISDASDDDEDDVDAVEEQNIMTEGKPLNPHPRPHTPSNDDSNDDNDDEPQGHRLQDSGILDPANEVLDDVDESASWAGIVSEIDEGKASGISSGSAFASDVVVERHVRFNIPSSESDSTDTDDEAYGDLFPDIFVDQTSLDPAFRREIELDPDESSGSGSYWDFSGQYEQTGDDSDAEEVINQILDNGRTSTTTTWIGHGEVPPAKFTSTIEESLELDGYETDGDTTEEDIPEPAVKRKSRRPSVPISEASDSDTPFFTATKTQRGQPRVGRFNLDQSDQKPIAVLNPLTRKMMIFTPHRRRQLDLSPEQFNICWPAEQEASPILSNSGNIMLSGLVPSNPFVDYVNSMGPTEAFFPFPSEPGTPDESSGGSRPENESEVEDEVDIRAFIRLDNDTSSADEGDADNWEPSSTPARPTTASSETEVLSHLNKNLVGAFKLNQINQQLISSNKATPDSLAFSGPYHYSAIRGLKSDRFQTAGVPLTPLRKQKKHAGGIIRSPLDSLSAKRKASSEVGSSHKRQRSISEVNKLEDIKIGD